MKEITDTYITNGMVWASRRAVPMGRYGVRPIDRVGPAKPRAKAWKGLQPPAAISWAPSNRFGQRLAGSERPRIDRCVTRLPALFSARSHDQ
jgi:hypothetical protein